MTSVYTEDTFKTFIKPNIIDLFLKMQKHTNSTMSKLNDKIRNLNAKFKRRGSDVQVCKKVNDALVKHAACPERQCWRNLLSSWWESVETLGMSNWLVHRKLCTKFCNILEMI